LHVFSRLHGHHNKANLWQVASVTPQPSSMEAPMQLRRHSNTSDEAAAALAGNDMQHRNSCKHIGGYDDRQVP
jgi:hypothetical protein